MRGQPIRFNSVLDARFGPASQTEFQPLRAWAERPTEAELSKHYRLKSGTKDTYVERVPCWEADHKGRLRAMVVAAGAPDRQSSLKAWSDAETEFRLGEQAEARSVEAAKRDGSYRPTPLGRELALRAARDQAWRNSENERHYDDRTSEAIVWRSWSRMCHISADNISFVKLLVAEGRWPLISRDGEAASHDAFLFVQHADDDPDFQEQMLGFLKPLVAHHEFLGKTYAALFDRVALAKGQPQRYGTQFRRGKHGCSAVRPVEDPTNLDRRRAEVGLPSIAEYAHTIADLHHTRVCENVFETSDTLHR